MTHNEYNGWWNYETWLVKLWVDNEQSSYQMWQDETRHLAEKLDKDAAIRTLANALKETHESGMPELPGIYSDLMNAAMSEVNWREIAETMVNDYLAENPE